MHMVVGYSAEQAYRLVMEGDGFGLIHVFKGCSEIKHDDTGAHLLIHAPNGDKRVYWKGGGKADSKNVITGLSLGSVFLCEVNLLHMEMLQELIRRTLAAHDRYMIADCNPSGPNHPVYTEFFKRFEKNADMYYLHWICEDNPTLSQERLKQIEGECSVSPFIYKRDWLGLRVMPEGTVYFMFDTEKHILPELPNDVQKIKMYFAGDGGTTDATSIGCYIVGRQQGKNILYRVGNWYYDKGQKALSTQAREVVTDFMPYMRNKYGMKESTVLIDPACKALRLELQKLGIPNNGADNNAHDVRNSRKGILCGIEMLQSGFTEDIVYLVEDDKYGTDAFVREASLYCFDDNGNPVDKYNHACDEFRYAGNYFFKNYGYWYGKVTGSYNKMR